LAVGTPKDTVKFVITNMAGDTVATMNGRGGAGMHQVMWNLSAKPPKPKPLTPAGRRDSLITVGKMDHVFDSLVAAGTVTKEQEAMIKERIDKGTIFDLFRGGGGGPGGPGGRPNDRPAESPLPPPARKDTAAKMGAADTAMKAGAADTGKAGRRPGGARGAGAGAPGEVGLDQDVARDVFGALRAAKALPGGGFGGRRGAGNVETGDYLVTMTVNGMTEKRVLRVENLVPAEGASGGMDEGMFEP
ncbi:MAG TPA: hypothetical protein VMT93_10010, partial [Gemmatimonadaceae bacterium]|nr:hypothetical protein [Gemmatimonadaceae bacterium]